jgi:rRNA processing protein Krr1/Pno1
MPKNMSKKQKDLVRAIAHGFRPNDAMKNVTKSQAKSWLNEDISRSLKKGR